MTITQNTLLRYGKIIFERIRAEKNVENYDMTLAISWSQSYRIIMGLIIQTGVKMPHMYYTSLEYTAVGMECSWFYLKS